MGEGEGEEALSLFSFHLSPFPPEMPDTQTTTAESGCVSTDNDAIN